MVSELRLGAVLGIRWDLVGPVKQGRLALGLGLHGLIERAGRPVLGCPRSRGVEGFAD